MFGVLKVRLCSVGGRGKLSQAPMSHSFEERLTLTVTEAIRRFLRRNQQQSTDLEQETNRATTTRSDPPRFPRDTNTKHCRTCRCVSVPSPRVLRVPPYRPETPPHTPQVELPPGHHTPPAPDADFPFRFDDDDLLMFGEENNYEMDDFNVLPELDPPNWDMDLLDDFAGLAYRSPTPPLPRRGAPLPSVPDSPVVRSPNDRDRTSGLPAHLTVPSTSRGPGASGLTIPPPQQQQQPLTLKRGRRRIYRFQDDSDTSSEEDEETVGPPRSTRPRMDDATGGGGGGSSTSRTPVIDLTESNSEDPDLR